MTSPGSTIDNQHSHDVEKDSASASKDSPSGGAAPSGPPAFVGFWSPQIKDVRKEYFIGMARVTVMITLLIWCFLPIYWGSLYREYLNTSRLHGTVINRDGNNSIGAAVESGMRQVSASKGSTHISWDIPSDIEMWTDDYINDQVAIEETTWAVIVVEAGATAALEQARANGDASWNPQSQVKLIYSEARNQQASSIVVSPAEASLAQFLAQVSTSMAASYLSTIANNATALNNLVAAPQTIASPISLAIVNLRPYSANPYNGAILAASYVGLIYLLVLSFNLVMGGFGMRQKIQRRLKLSSLIGMRILVPVIIYLWLSLMLTLLQAAFHLDFNGWGRGYGAGFMVFWMTSFCGMVAMGLCLEAILSLVGPQFVAIGLILLIIINVSGALLPPDLCGAFYKYSYAMLFYNLKQIFLTIFANAGKHIYILKYWGIIMAWIVVVCLTFPIWIWRERRAMLEQMKSGKGPGGPPH